MPLDNTEYHPELFQGTSHGIIDATLPGFLFRPGPEKKKSVTMPREKGLNEFFVDRFHA